MNKICLKIFFLLLLFPCICFPAFSQETDYRVVFGKNWEKAEEFLIRNEPWMKELASEYKVSYPLAIAIIFPELVRYSALFDRIEITMLKTLYINLGDDYADFSVGQFQMKPSFAESIHDNAHLLKRKIRILFSQQSGFDTPRKYRASVLADLENTERQFLYLIAFIKICENSFDTGSMDTEMKLRFLSTAYNYSFRKSYEEIISMSGKKFFSTKLNPSVYYSYSDISLYWFRDFVPINNENSGIN